MFNSQETFGPLDSKNRVTLASLGWGFWKGFGSYTYTHWLVAHISCVREGAANRAPECLVPQKMPANECQIDYRPVLSLIKPLDVHSCFCREWLVVPWELSSSLGHSQVRNIGLISIEFTSVGWTHFIDEITEKATLIFSKVERWGSLSFSIMDTSPQSMMCPLLYSSLFDLIFLMSVCFQMSTPLISFIPLLAKVTVLVYLSVRGKKSVVLAEQVKMPIGSSGYDVRPLSNRLFHSK